MPFKTLRLIEPLLRAVHAEGYTLPTAIQQQAIPHVLEGRDLLGSAQTGTGKTAAFALPILQRLHTAGGAKAEKLAEGSGPKAHTGHAAPAGGHHRQAGHGPRVERGGGHEGARRPIRALILTPTRELAAQIGESFGVYGRHLHLRHTVIYGGVGQGPQAAALRRGVDILVATPGRLLDLLNQRLLTLRDVEIFVLDEADRMLDMGFIHDIRKVIGQIPAQRQTLLFSATMPKEIRAMANQVLTHPVQVSVPAESPAADTVAQALYFIEPARKLELLEHLLEEPGVTRALVFTRTKRGADRVVHRLVHAGVEAEAIHSDKSQNARQKALENFKRNRTRVLVASDIAARGLDVDNISHVINYDMPGDAETYVHRIGRTGRAGAQGKAISLCTREEQGELRQVEKLLGRRITVLNHKLAPAPAAAKPAPKHQAHGHAPARAAAHSTTYSSHSAPRATGAHAKAAPKEQEKKTGQAAHGGHSGGGQKSPFWRGKRRGGRPSSRPHRKH
ncbi:MAG: DEAD/DEAH box helicase [Phycisphaeraceae bacterium]|nr:DEAD/DEAH box helicase [Phycisphaeraceae bacterium]